MKNISVKAIIECCVCGRRQHVDLWAQLLVGEDRAIDDLIYNDGINYFECKRCGSEGFACHPIKIIHRESGSVATMIQAYSLGFYVAQTGVREKRKIIYDLEDLKWQIFSWQGIHAVFDPPPKEEDIKEALEKGFLDRQQAEFLRNTDWDLLHEQIEGGVEDERCVEPCLDEGQDRAVDLYLNFMSRLNLSRKVVTLHG